MIEEVKTFVATCDRCRSKSKPYHYGGTPEGWSKYGFPDSPIRGMTSMVLLCPVCLEEMEGSMG